MHDSTHEVSAVLRAEGSTKPTYDVVVVGTNAARDVYPALRRRGWSCSATSTSGDRDLNVTLHPLYRSFGDVRCTDELLDLVGCPA